MDLEQEHLSLELQLSLGQLQREEAKRLHRVLEDVHPVLLPLVDAAALAYARYWHAERMWVAEGGRPDSPWLKVARDALRDYQAVLRLLLKHADEPQENAKGRDLFAVEVTED